jgi:predicted nucleic-acid-binding Zn-ribbon protein
MLDIQSARQNALRLVSAHVPDCPICGAQSWESGRLNDDELRLTANQIGATPPPKAKHLQIECESCGYTITFRIDRVAAYKERP